MSDNVCTVWKVELPIVGGTAAHNFQAYLDKQAIPFHETHGLATDEDGNTKPIGWLPSDRLMYKNETDYSGWYYNPSYNKELLFSGDCSVVEEKYQLANTIGEEINNLNLHYPFMGLGENSNSVNTTLNIGVFGKDPDIDNNKIDIGQGHLLISEERLKEISDNFYNNLNNKDNIQNQEIELTGNETELPDITVIAEKPEQIDDYNTHNFIDENHYLNNNDDFFGDHLNQYAEDNGISHINTYDYHQFANDDNSSNGISYLNDYNLSFGSGYWRQPFDYYNGFGEHQETITESELERILDDNNESKIKDTLMDLQTGSLKIDTDGFSSISSSLEKKLEENNISKTEIENAIKTSHSSSWNLFDDLPMYDMPVIYDMPMHAYELPYYIEDTQEFNSQQAINDNEDNSVSGSLNDNHQDNMIARVSDDPIILVKDENDIDKVMSVSEYEQYNALLQERLNNELNQAKQEIHEELNNVEDTLNQQIDNIEQDILSTELSSNENDSIIDTYSIQNDNTENKIISFEEYLKQQENSFNFDDDDLFKVISDEEVFSINNEYCCDCKDDNPDDWLF